MRFGHFDDQNKEYVITTPQTPLPWINYLGSEDFFSLVSNTAGGYSFYRDARLRRLTRYRYNSSPLDMDGLLRARMRPRSCCICWIVWQVRSGRRFRAFIRWICVSVF